jgi:hypothetical protein
VNKRLLRLRAASYKAQDSRCFYCGAVMWLGDSSAFQERFGLEPRRIRAFQCTAEHLQARCDGGLDEATNVVAACRRCNQRRHQRLRGALPPNEYGRWVTQRVSERKWHPSWAFEAGLVSSQGYISSATWSQTLAASTT